ncbi:hypothetical protein HDU83_002734 [Entophlyctis luteolus]|nr:hypothetical protein HDU83_002734 [Entophlyctis luteolus]
MSFVDSFLEPPVYHEGNRFSEPVHFLLQSQNSIASANPYAVQQEQEYSSVMHNQSQSFKLPRMVRSSNQQQNAPSMADMGNIFGNPNSESFSNGSVVADGCSHHQDNTTKNDPTTLPPIHSVVEMGEYDGADNCEECREEKTMRNIQVLVWLKFLIRTEMDTRFQRQNLSVI